MLYQHPPADDFTRTRVLDAGVPRHSSSMDRFIYVIQDSTAKMYFASARYERVGDYAAHATIVEHEWIGDADKAFFFSTYDAAQRTLDDLRALQGIGKLHIILTVGIPTTNLAAAKDAYRADHPRDETEGTDVRHPITGKVIGCAYPPRGNIKVVIGTEQPAVRIETEQDYRNAFGCEPPAPARVFFAKPERPIRKVLGYTRSTHRGKREYVCIHCATETTTPLHRTAFPVYDPSDTEPCCVCSTQSSYADDMAEVR